MIGVFGGHLQHRFEIIAFLLEGGHGAAEGGHFREELGTGGFTGRVGRSHQAISRCNPGKRRWKFFKDFCCQG